MVMEIFGDTEGLKREILEMARRECAEIISAAEAEAGKILADAEAGAEETWRGISAAALAEAGRRREALLASVPREAGLMRLARQEAVLDSIKAEALRLLPAENKPAALAALAAQAIGRMEGREFVVSLVPADMGGAAGLASEIERLCGRQGLILTIEESSVFRGGVLVRDREGRQSWDNSFDGRLARLWPELRGRLLRSMEAK